MRLLTEVQDCISLMDKKLRHFVEALLVSNKMWNESSQYVFLYLLNVQFVCHLEGPSLYSVQEL